MKSIYNAISSEEIDIVDKLGTVKGKIIAQSNAMSGEITYNLATTEFGGLWVKGDWVSDKYWTYYGSKALEKEHPVLYQKLMSFMEKVENCKYQSHCPCCVSCPF